MVEQTLPVHMGSWRTVPGHHPLWEEVVPTRSCSRNHDLGLYAPEYVREESRSPLEPRPYRHYSKLPESVLRWPSRLPRHPYRVLLVDQTRSPAEKHGTCGWKPPHRPRGQVGTSDKEWHVILAVWHDSGHGLEDGGTSEGERRPAGEGRAGPPPAGRGGRGGRGPRRGCGCRADS